MNENQHLYHNCIQDSEHIWSLFTKYGGIHRVLYYFKVIILQQDPSIARSLRVSFVEFHCHLVGGDFKNNF